MGHPGMKASQAAGNYSRTTVPSIQMGVDVDLDNMRIAGTITRF